MLRKIFLFLFLLFFTQLLTYGQTDTIRIKFDVRGEKPLQYPVKVAVDGLNKSFVFFGNEAVIPVPDKKAYNLTFESDYLRKKSYQFKTADFDKMPKVTFDPFWLMHNNTTFFFSQASFNDYWQGGGLNNLNVGVRYDGKVSFVRDKFNHETEINVRHGFIRQGKNSFIKNEDDLNITAKESYVIGSNFHLSVLLSLRSSIYRTYSINADGTKGAAINDFLSPGTINIGTGLDYKIAKPKFSFYYSPVNLKSTIVLDSLLRPVYLPADFEGAVRFEMGSLFKYEFDIETFKNINLISKGELFSNYLVNFGNIDINIEMGVRFKVNNVFSTTLIFHTIYDDDIRFNIKDQNGMPTDHLGPRLQFRQALNMQLSYSF